MKILIFTPWHAFAHAVRCISIAKHLPENQFSVICVGQEETTFMDIANKEGFDCYTVNLKMGPLGRHDLDLYTQGTADIDFHLLTDLFTKINPDLILSDAAPIVPLCAEKLMIPHISLVSASWTNYYAPKRHLLKWHAISYYLGWKIQRFIRYCWSRHFEMQLSKWGQPLNCVAAMNNLKKRKNILSYMGGNTKTLVTDVPAFGKLANKPVSFEYCGPIVWNPSFHSHELLKRLDEEKPVIYISFGSSGAFFFLEKIVNWLLDAGWQIILTTAFSQIHLFENQNRNPNLIVADFVNVNDILPYCAAAIFHGGGGTAYQLLMHKKPSIVIPTHFEQGWNAYRLQELGVSSILTPRLLTKRRLLKTVDHILTIDQANFEKLEFCQPNGIDLNYGPKLAADIIAGLFDGSASSLHPHQYYQ